MSAHAMRLAEPGEAQLVPFVLWDDQPICVPVPPGTPIPPPQACGAHAIPPIGPGILSINTAVKITVPKAVGSDVVPNFFTATHTTPTNDPFCNPPGNPFVTGCEDPADPDLDPTNVVHWYFLNQRSQHELNGTITVSPDDVAVIDWGATVRQNGKQATLNGVPGYLVLTTQAGSRGNDADFSFFAEAWGFFGFSAGVVPNTGGTIGLLDAYLPTLAMTDGADTLGDTTPTLDNNVIELNTQSVIASPLVTGIRTNWSDGNPTDIKVVDLTLGNRSIPISGVTNIFQVPTLMVVWNDRNAGGAWSGLGVDVYNDREESCSDSIDLPDQLNLIWVQTDVTAGVAPPYVTWPTPRFIERFGQSRVYCVPPTTATSTPLENLDRLLSGGFMKLYLPELVDNGIFQPESAMAAFSVPLQYFVTLENLFGVPLPTDISLIPFETALAHDRAMFNRAP
jgi:hypothetical protein